MRFLGAFFFAGAGLCAACPSAWAEADSLALYSLWPAAPPPAPLPQGWRTLQGPSRGLDRSTPGRSDRDADVFVRLRLDASSDARLKDSLADLSQGAGFRPDRRFDPVLSPKKNSALVWGWISPDAVGRAVRIPAVEKIAVAQTLQSRRGESEKVLVGLGIKNSAAQTLSDDLPRLERETGFNLDQVIGYQPVPNSDRIVLVLSGEIPISKIGELLDRPDVVKVLPRVERRDFSPARVLARNPLDFIRRFPVPVGLAAGLLIGGSIGLAVLFAGS